MYSSLFIMKTLPPKKGYHYSYIIIQIHLKRNGKTQIRSDISLLFLFERFQPLQGLPIS